MKIFAVDTFIVLCVGCHSDNPKGCHTPMCSMNGSQWSCEASTVTLGSRRSLEPLEVDTKDCDPQPVLTGIKEIREEQELSLSITYH